MASICENIQQIKSEIGNAQLVVVSKYRSMEELQEVYDCGHRDLGENRVQELLDKYEIMPKDIKWHAIGHLQTNKVKYIAPFIHLIHSVDSFKLLRKIQSEAEKVNRVIPFLFQMHIAEEDTKYGLDKNELFEIFSSDEFATMHNVKCEGLMGMSTNTENTDQVLLEFKGLKDLYDELSSDHKLSTLSMGMSGDYILAIEQGSSMVRVGSKIFTK